MIAIFREKKETYSQLNLEFLNIYKTENINHEFFNTQIKKQ